MDQIMNDGAAAITPSSSVGGASAVGAAQGPQAKMTYACESCRAAKVKCTSSRQPGICRRCLDSKRECVFKTGPRTRRPRLSRQTSLTERPPPPPGPSKTFTIDVPLPREEHLADPLAVLRDSHEAYLDRLMPSPSYDGDFFDDETGSVMANAAGGSSTRASATTPSSATYSASTGTTNAAASSARLSTEPGSPLGLGLRRPQFNLDSAAELLTAFRKGMDPYFPVAAIGEDDTVSSLARDRPFVLLAVLAAASGARIALRGGRGSLYDEEFRKILGLKFVAGGERSVELLVGLLVYCAWYPVHLRPKSKQSTQYVRMAVDLVQDLELDQPEAYDQLTGHERLQAIRAYLCCYYLVVFRGMAYMTRQPSLNFTPWTATCCDILEREGTRAGDRVLPWLVRNQHLVDETAALTRVQDQGQRSQYQVDTMLRGLEAQFRDWKNRVPEEIAQTPVMTISSLTTEIYLYTSHLWKDSPFRAPKFAHAHDPYLDPGRMALALPLLRSFLELLAGWTQQDTLSSPQGQVPSLSGSTPGPPSSTGAALDGASDEEFANFSTIEWGRTVFNIVLCFRMSFDMPACPLWDGARGRRELELGRFLAAICGDCDDFYDEIVSGQGGALRAVPMNVVCATKVVFSVVKRKFERRVAQLPPAEAMNPQPPTPGLVSMMLGSLGGGGGGFFGGGGGSSSSNHHSAAAAAMTSDMRVGLDKTMRGCPMLDGSLDNFFPIWGADSGSAASAGYYNAKAAATGVGLDAGMGSSSPGEAAAPAAVDLLNAGGGAGGSLMGDVDSAQAAMIQDLWATMTNGWSQDGTNDMSF